MATALWLCRCGQTTAAVGLAGFLTLCLLARGTNLASAARFPRWTFGCWAGLCLAGGLLLVLTTAEMSGLPPGQAVGTGAMRDVLDGTDFGAVWSVRAGLLAALLLAGGFVAKRARTLPPPAAIVPDAALLALAAALLGSLVWTGHARMSEHGGWLFPLNVLHILAAGAWPGGLLPLGLLLAQARREPARLSAAVTVARRFSWLSVVAVGLLAGSGLAAGCGLVGTFSALWTSLYGRLLLCKTLLFAGLVVLGAWNRHLLGQPVAASPAVSLHRLARNVAWESLLAGGVLLVTEALAMSAPPFAPK